jgi:hypothetical protein
LPRRRQIATPFEQLNKYQLWRGNSIARGLRFARREVALRSPP